MRKQQEYTHQENNGKFNNSTSTLVWFNIEKMHFLIKFHHKLGCVAVNWFCRSKKTGFLKF